MYLRLKSFQRFTETWALLERCAAGGLFDATNECGILAPSSASVAATPLRVVSLGGEARWAGVCFAPVNTVDHCTMCAHCVADLGTRV